MASRCASVSDRAAGAANAALAKTAIAKTAIAHAALACARTLWMRRYEETYDKACGPPSRREPATGSTLCNVRLQPSDSPAGRGALQAKSPPIGNAIGGPFLRVAPAFSLQQKYGPR